MQWKMWPATLFFWLVNIESVCRKLTILPFNKVYFLLIIISPEKILNILSIAGVSFDAKELKMAMDELKKAIL